MKSQPFPLIGRYRFGWSVFWLCAIMLVLSLTIGMNESIRNFPFTWMSVFGIAAITSGWILAGWQRRTTVALILGVFSGLILLVFVDSEGYKNLFSAYYEGVRSIRLTLPYHFNNENLQRMIILIHRLIADLENFYEQLQSWMLSFYQEQSAYNPAIVSTLWGFFLWGASFLTGWMLRRMKHTFIASLPILALLTGVLGYTRQNTSGLVIGLTSLLTLNIILEHLTLENRWQSNRVDFSEEIRFDVVSLGIPIVIIIMIIAGFFPNIPYDKIREFYNQNLIPQENVRVQFDDSLGLQTTPRPQFSSSRPGTLPRSFLIGSGPELSETLVMEIDTEEIFSPPEYDRRARIPNYYWFGRSYDIYTGSGWEASDFSLDTVPRNNVIVSADPNTSRILHQKINKTTNASTTLYSSGLPQSVDQRITVGWRDATGEYYSAQLDAQAYEVESSILEISTESLQEANQEAPEEIVNNYLNINPAIPQRVLDLASSITEEAANPYEKAKAIESYLRQFEYTLELPSPPEDEDIVDYFLFDLQKGYCDYFASAMVVLARAVGLPARLAVGYAPSEYDYVRQLFVVTEANAHAWPEIYIAPYGWIPFEPTTSQTPISWDTRPELPTEIESVPPDASDEVPGQAFWPDILALIGLVSLFIIIFFGHKFINLRDRQTSTTQQIERIHRRMKTRLKRLFTLPQSSKTPLEFQNELIDWLNQQKSSRVDTWLIDQIKNKLHTLTDLYHQGIYTPRPLSENQIITARHDLANLVTQAWVLNVVLTITGK